MTKYTDKTDDEWDDLIELWHESPELTMSLQEFLDLDEEQYLRLVHGIRDDSLTYEEVLEMSRKICMDVVQNCGTPIFTTVVKL